MMNYLKSDGNILEKWKGGKEKKEKRKKKRYY
jgi:hypothetical protein